MYTAQTMQQQLDPSVSWRDTAWVRERWRGPLIVKGRLDPQQARHAREAGADAIVVSNHGGRQLDGAAASIDMLPEFGSEVGGRLPILIDTGFRSGTDVAKALALGASAVQLGRATLFAASAGGRAGVERALALIRDELDVALCSLGAKSIGELHGGMVRRAQRTA